MKKRSQVVCNCDGNIVGTNFTLEIDEFNNLEITCAACKFVVGSAKVRWMDQVTWREVE